MTNENIKYMFFSSLGILPIFGIDNNPNVIEELMEENDLGDFQEENEIHDLNELQTDNKPENKKVSKKRKKNYGLLYSIILIIIKNFSNLKNSSKTYFYNYI